MKLLRLRGKQTGANWYIQQAQSIISIDLELCLCPPDECKSNINSSFSSVLVSTNLTTNIYCLSSMLKFLHQLATNFVC